MPRARWLVAGAAAAAAADVGLHLLDTLVLDGSVPLLDASSDVGLDATVSAAAASVAALAAATSAWRSPQGRRRALVVAAVFGFLAVDMVTGLHERLSAVATTIAAAPSPTDDWPTPVLYAPLFAITAVALWRYPGRGMRSARAAVLVLGGALALRPVAAAATLHWHYRPDGALREVVVGLQQGLELAGWLLVASAAVVTVLGLRRAGPGRVEVVKNSVDSRENFGRTLHFSRRFD
jgi:hypothetical protein